MRVLWWCLGVLLFLLLLLLIPLRLELDWLKKRLTLRVRWLFIKKELLPPAPKAPPKEPPAEAKEAEESAKKAAKSPDLRGWWALMQELLPRAFPITRRLLRRIVVSDIYVGWLLARPEAAAAAIACGRAYAALNAALATLARFFTLRPWEIDIRPEYSGRRFDELAVHAEIRLVPAAFLAAGVLLGLQFGLSLYRIRPKTLFREEVPHGT